MCIMVNPVKSKSKTTKTPRKQAKKPTAPAESITDAQRLAMLTELPPEKFGILETLVEILSLPSKWPWMETRIQRHMVEEGNSIMRVVLLAYLDTLTPDLREEVRKRLKPR